MKYQLLIQEISKSTNEIVKEWRKEFDSMKDAIELIKLIDEAVSSNFFRFKYTILGE